MKPIDFILGLLAVIVAVCFSFAGLFESADTGQAVSLLASIAAVITVTALALKTRAGSLSRRLFQTCAVAVALLIGSLSALAVNRQVSDSGTFEFRWSSTSYSQSPFFRVIGRDGTNGFGVNSNGAVIVTLGGTNHLLIRTNGTLIFFAQ